MQCKSTRYAKMVGAGHGARLLGGRKERKGGTRSKSSSMNSDFGASRFRRIGKQREDTVVVKERNNLN